MEQNCPGFAILFLGGLERPPRTSFLPFRGSTARGNPFSPDITDCHVAPLLAMTSPIGVRNGFLRSLRSVEMTEGTERCGHRSLRGCDCERRWQMPLAKRSLCLSPAFLFRPRWRSATFPPGEGIGRNGFLRSLRSVEMTER